MNTSMPDVVRSGVHGHAIARLSNDLRIPLNEVATVYQSQLDRIGATARIHNYLSLLAASRARAILRRRESDGLL